MTEELTTRDVFAKRAEQWDDKAPVFAAICRTIAEEPELAACVADAPVAGRPKHNPMWSRPHQLAGLITRLLRTKASGHELARYWATLGGARGVDAALPEAFRDFARRYDADLATLATTHSSSRGNDPLVAVMLWPGIAWAASEAAGPVAFLELGSAAGTCLFADRFGYRYGDRLVGGDRPLVLETGWDGEHPDLLSASVDVVARVGLEREPVRFEDEDAIAWLRDCVLPDNADEAARLDGALSVMESGGIDWRAGDYMETLPTALSDVPTTVTPIVFGAHTLCCAADPERLPRILAEVRPRPGVGREGMRRPRARAGQRHRVRIRGARGEPGTRAADRRPLPRRTGQPGMGARRARPVERFAGLGAASSPAALTGSRCPRSGSSPSGRGPVADTRVRETPPNRERRLSP